MYKFYDTESHGYLAVPESDLDDLGIKDKITKFSYVIDGIWYLEEDCDATIFWNAYKSKYGKDVPHTTIHYGDKDTRIFNILMY